MNKRRVRPIAILALGGLLWVAQSLFPTFRDKQMTTGATFSFEKNRHILESWDLAQRLVHSLAILLVICGALWLIVGSIQDRQRVGEGPPE